MKKVNFFVVFFVFSFVLLCSGCASSADFDNEAPDPKLNAEVQKILDDAVKRGVQTSVQCCVYINGKKVVDAWSGTYAKESDRKIDGDTLYPIFSTGKAFLATTVHSLVGKGVLDYEMKLADVWPAYACKGKEDTRLWQVLSHRSGLVGTPKYDSLLEYANWDIMAQKVAEMPLANQPGTKTAYQPTIYAWLLGEPMQRVTGKSLHTLMTEEVLAPCNIENQVYFGNMDSKTESRVATIYPHATKGQKYVPGSKPPYPAYYMMNQQICRKICVPSYCGIASARGLAKFYAHLGGMRNPSLLKPEILEKATRLNRHPSEPLPLEQLDRWVIFAMGYVLYGEKENLSAVFGHGGLGGSEAIVDTKKKIAVAYTSSDDNWESNQEIRWAIYKAIGIKVRGQK